MINSGKWLPTGPEGAPQPRVDQSATPLVLAHWREHGYVVLPGYVAGPSLDAAIADLPVLFPTAEAFHSGADPRSQRYRNDEFGGIDPFLFSSLAASLLAVDDRLVELAQSIFDGEDLRLYSCEVWAKYTGAAGYEQEHHRDYLNHTPLAPSSDVRFRGLEMFVWLSDVAEEHGPTHVVPFGLTAGLPALPHGYLRSERPDLYAAEVSGAGPAGTVLAYSTDTFHRGTQFTAPQGARFALHASYRRAENAWTNRSAWGDRSFDPAWQPFVEAASLAQLLLFGFPPPGHPYWTAETLAGMQVRYPGLDRSPWQAADPS